MISQEFWNQLLDESMNRPILQRWDEEPENNYGYGDDYDPDDLDF